MARVALVTGSSRNIGKSIAEAFAEQGDAVVLNAAVSSDELAATAAEFAAKGRPAIACLADTGDPEAVTAMVDRAVEAFGGIDVLVINHSVRPVAPLLELTPEQWFAVQDANLNSAFYLCRAVIPVMLERGGGSIVAIGGGRPGRLSGARAHVMASLTGRAALLRSVMYEFAPSIRVNFVLPGIMDTVRKHPEWYPDQGGSPAEDPRVLEAIPLGRIGTPADVARAVVWLASEQAGYVNGATVAVTGGWGM